MTSVSNKISASILSANFLNLEKDIENLIKNNIKFIHCDVMDGRFVPNISFGQPLISAVYEKFKNQIIIDTHLMIWEPEVFIDDFLKYSDIISFHYEATQKHTEIIEKIKKNNKKVTMAIKPKTTFEEIKLFLKDLDFILIMTVEPGFSGQKFMVNQMEKMKQISNFIKKNKLQAKIQVDGGINEETIKLCQENGAEIFAMASYLFGEGDLKEKLERLEKALN